ncbi:hypothetical protein [Clostridium sp. Marseille-P2415]|uniref:hypothetical protein n=1 Tax=Clostridium sp. Marseille-P2415 TaxID=1805471 RepID=UPI00111590CC|nr:hypothetical protein [Clostridium sp. Marseille-P2415]
MSTIIHSTIRLEMPFAMKSITKLEIVQRLNEHSWAQLEGTIRDEDVNTCSYLSWKENFTIKHRDSQADQILFSGIPVNIKVTCGEQAHVSIRLCSYSMIMEYEKKTRSFQRKDRTYAALLKELVQGNGGDIIDYASASAAYDAPLIQYEETDWEFLKRVSSYIGASVYPAATGSSLQIYIGFGSNKNRISRTSDREMKKSIREYRNFRNISSAPSESDFISCYTAGGWDCRLGDQISCDGQEYRVTEIHDSLKNGLLSRRCLLQIESGICRKKEYQEKIKGASLSGVIREVKADRIRLRLDVDGKVQGEKLHWYPWHRNDWFCMPETGSKAMLYIPEGDEGQAYVTDIIRTDGEKNPLSQNPERKCFVTESRKGMEVSPQSISFRAAGKKLSVQLSDSSGVKIRSSCGIHIYAGEMFLCRSRNLKIESGERIVLSTGKTSIVIDDLVQIKG